MKSSNKFKIKKLKFKIILGNNNSKNEKINFYISRRWGDLILIQWTLIKSKRTFREEWKGWDLESN